MVSSQTPSGRRVRTAADSEPRPDHVVTLPAAEVLDSRRSRRLAHREAAAPATRTVLAPTPIAVDGIDDAPEPLQAPRAPRVSRAPRAASAPTAATATNATSANATSAPRTRAEAKAARASHLRPPRASLRAPAAPGAKSAPADAADETSTVLLPVQSEPTTRTRPAVSGRRAARAAASSTVASSTAASGTAASSTVASSTVASGTAASGTAGAGIAASTGVTSASGTAVTDVTRGRRAARPAGARRRAEVSFGRVVSNRRAWGAALAVALVLVVPGASMISRPPATVADDSLFSGDGGAYEQFPSVDPTTTEPSATSLATAAATAAARAKATAEAAAKAKAAATATQAPATSRRSTTPASRSRNTSGPLAGINGARSGLPYASGLYMPGSKPSNATAFGDWRGRAVDVVVDWPARQNWDDIENPDWLIRAWAGTPYTKVWGVAPIPEDGTSSLASCAAGANNAHWRTFGQNMKNSGYSDQIVIRLGWEFNGNWYKWSATKPADFAACWRQIVGTVSAIAPDLRWDWNVNRGPNSVADAAAAYPGDDYVDIVGIDSYDQYPGVTSEADWQTQYSGPYGLKHWVDFAKAHGKPFSVPEWGLYPTRGSNSGGDNALYIKKMLGFFAANEANLAYESYFNEPASYYKGAIFNPSLNPSAAAEYKSLLGG